jgi:hypothetical protein
MEKVVSRRNIWIIVINLIWIGYATGDCYWSDVDDSHDPAGDWCNEGYAITAIDYDSFDDDTASPIIGAVRCCSLPGSERITNWKTFWKEIGADWSHYASEGRYPMCPKGSYISAIDLDSIDNGGNSPIIGRVQCAEPTGIPTWMQTYWRTVGYDKSHNKGGSWCKSNGFIVSLDLDSEGDPGNSPIVGQCECASAG